MLKPRTLMIALLMLLFTRYLAASEFSVRGVIDMRLTHNSTNTSYRDGGYGKFDLNDNQSLSLSQAGLSLKLDFDNGFSGHLVANGYQQNDKTDIGITEGYFKYLSLPSEQGYRWQSRLGVYYPEISLENNATAWASKYTLNSSAINTWIGEEIRVLGNEYTVTRLGKFHENSFDLSATVGAFINNDPSGALLAWHGWTVGNRQTLWTEKVRLPPLFALQPGNPLDGHQAVNSDPFYEVDDNVGWYGNIKLKLHRQGKLLFGYYNNNATPYLVEEGQYGWQTRFGFAGLEWHFPHHVTLTSQWLQGDTLMQNGDKVDIVKNDYQAGFVMLSKRIERHRISLRLEEFSITDQDAFSYDNNNEYGKSYTFNYSYRLSKPWFLSIEHNWVNSKRPARAYNNLPEKLTEYQSQIAVRYFY